MSDNSLTGIFEEIRFLSIEASLHSSKNSSKSFDLILTQIVVCVSYDSLLPKFELSTKFKKCFEVHFHLALLMDEWVLNLRNHVLETDHIERRDGRPEISKTINSTLIT